MLSVWFNRSRLTLNVKSCKAICQKEHQVLLPIFGTCTLTVEEHQFLISKVILLHSHQFPIYTSGMWFLISFELSMMGQLFFSHHLQYLHPHHGEQPASGSWRLHSLSPNWLEQTIHTQHDRRKHANIMQCTLWNKDRMGIAGQTPRGDTFFHDKP